MIQTWAASALYGESGARARRPQPAARLAASPGSSERFQQASLRSGASHAHEPLVLVPVATIREGPTR